MNLQAKEAFDILSSLKTELSEDYILLLSLSHLMLGDLQEAKKTIKTLKQSSILVSVLRACIQFEIDKLSGTQKSVSILMKTLDYMGRKRVYSEERFEKDLVFIWYLKMRFLLGLGKFEEAK